MTKGLIEFDLPSEQEEYDLALNASKYEEALLQIKSQIFEAAKRNGYKDKELTHLLNKYEGSEELIAALEKKFLKILKYHGIKL
jgi:hypothetical protein